MANIDFLRRLVALRIRTGQLTVEDSK